MRWFRSIKICWCFNDWLGLMAKQFQCLNLAIYSYGYAVQDFVDTTFWYLEFP